MARQGSNVLIKTGRRPTISDSPDLPLFLLGLKGVISRRYHLCHRQNSLGRPQGLPPPLPPDMKVTVDHLLPHLPISSNMAGEVGGWGQARPPSLGR